MLKYSQIKCPIGYTMDTVKIALAKKLNIKQDDIKNLGIIRESLDARKKPDLFYSLTVKFTVAKEEKFLQSKSKKDSNLTLYHKKEVCFPSVSLNCNRKRPIIAGAGPAGLFCAYYLAKAGLNPIVFERGKDVDSRLQDVLNFWESGVLNTKSNVQFGEGGAGTFSDGKLNTLNKDPFGYQHEVLSLFVELGASPKIIYEQKPHLGTDCLFQIVKNLRNIIISLGGNIYFESQITDFMCDPVDESNKVLKKVIVNHKDEYETDCLILAIGHSARDTFQMLYDKHVSMEAKSFAVGYRVQHLQSFIDECQYGKANVGKLPPAAYKLTAQTKENRGVYSFCMCPGGYVVNASSEENRLCVNGMSYSDRAGVNANSAIIVSVTKEDYGSDDALAGVHYQEQIEEKAYKISTGKIPVQRYEDYIYNKTSNHFGVISPEIKGQYAFGNLRNVFSDSIEQAFIEGMESFGRKMPGFNHKDVLLTGFEARTSSPVRIHRNDKCESINIKGLYPCGEGAGYAGGITSAACDGLHVALNILNSLGGN